MNFAPVLVEDVHDDVVLVAEDELLGVGVLNGRDCQVVGGGDPDGSAAYNFSFRILDENLKEVE